MFFYRPWYLCNSTVSIFSWHLHLIEYSLCPNVTVAGSSNLHIPYRFIFSRSMDCFEFELLLQLWFELQLGSEPPPAICNIICNDEAKNLNIYKLK
jgi:hypothetical protein